MMWTVPEKMSVQARLLSFISLSLLSEMLSFLLCCNIRAIHSHVIYCISQFNIQYNMVKQDNLYSPWAFRKYTVSGRNSFLSFYLPNLKKKHKTMIWSMFNFRLLILDQSLGQRGMGRFSLTTSLSSACCWEITWSDTWQVQQRISKREASPYANIGEREILLDQIEAARCCHSWHWTENNDMIENIWFTGYRETELFNSHLILRLDRLTSKSLKKGLNTFDLTAIDLLILLITMTL